MTAVETYQFRIGGGDRFEFSGGLASVGFQTDATALTNDAYESDTLAIAGKEDTNGDGTEDTYFLIPSCESGDTTVDGRCTTTLAADGDGDGVVDAYDLSAQVPHFSTYAVVAFTVCPALVDVNPETINLKSRGRYVTTYVELGTATCPFDAGEIDVETVTLAAIAPVASETLSVSSDAPSTVGDHNQNGVPDLMVKFDRPVVQSWFSASGTATFRVVGNFTEGTLLTGEDATVRVKHKGR
jgi:hypothetical protein